MPSTQGADAPGGVNLPFLTQHREGMTAGGGSMNDPRALESELAPESEVLIEVSRRLPVLLVLAVALAAVVCWRAMRRHEGSRDTTPEGGQDAN